MITRIERKEEVTIVTDDEGQRALTLPEYIPRLYDHHRVKLVKPNKNSYEFLAINLTAFTDSIAMTRVDYSITQVPLDVGDIVTIKSMAERLEQRKVKLW